MTYLWNFFVGKELNSRAAKLNPGIPSGCEGWSPPTGAKKYGPVMENKLLGCRVFFQVVP